MTYATSRVLNQRQLTAVERIGDILLPRNGDFPAFSETGCLSHIDTVLAPSHPQDIKDLKIVLSLLGTLPIPLLKGFLTLLGYGERLPKILGSQLKLLEFGLRGIVFSLYYSGKGSVYKPDSGVYTVMDYQVHCAPDA